MRAITTKLASNMFSGLLARTKNVGIAVDQLVWVLLTLGSGYPDETLSAAMYRWERFASGHRRVVGEIARPVIDFLVRPFGKDHCRLSYESEKYRKQLPGVYRGSS